MDPARRQGGPRAALRGSVDFGEERDGTLGVADGHQVLGRSDHAEVSGVEGLERTGQFAVTVRLDGRQDLGRLDGGDQGQPTAVVVPDLEHPVLLEVVQFGGEARVDEVSDAHGPADREHLQQSSVAHRQVTQHRGRGPSRGGAGQRSRGEDPTGVDPPQLPGDHAVPGQLPQPVDGSRAVLPQHGRGEAGHGSPEHLFEQTVTRRGGQRPDCDPGQGPQATQGRQVDGNLRRPVAVHDQGDAVDLGQLCQDGDGVRVDLIRLGHDHDGRLTSGRSQIVRQGADHAVDVRRGSLVQSREQDGQGSVRGGRRERAAMEPEDRAVRADP
ncbi:hypothetical protein ACFFX0_26810 [Citricoccus parietis]|uniref:Uncharacterized protein n=1 Tax=Citricoccus parietis TaxID=592307 RepID=A0ABV5G6S7_9MICC